MISRVAIIKGCEEDFNSCVTIFQKALDIEWQVLQISIQLNFMFKIVNVN